MARATVSRDDPAAAQLISTRQYTNPITGEVGVHHETFSQHGHPLSLRMIANGVSTINRDYPYDGDGTAAGGSSSTIILDSGVPTNIEYANLLVVNLTTAEVRLINSFDTGTRTATVNRNWDAGNPTNGTPYILLVDCYEFMDVYVKCESNDADVLPTLELAFYDVPDTVRAPRRVCDAIVQLPNMAHTRNVTVSGRNHIQGYSTSARGCLGFKVGLPALAGASPILDIYAGVG